MNLSLSCLAPATESLAAQREKRSRWRPLGEARLANEDVDHQTALAVRCLVRKPTSTFWWGPFGVLRSEVPATLGPQLRFLGNIQRGLEPRRIMDDALVGVYPRRPVIPRLNKGIIYDSWILYCAARLAIVGLALSRWNSRSKYS